MMRPHVWIVMAVGLYLCAGPDLADAQTPRSGGESQKMMQQYQQLAAEKTALQEQLAQSKKDLDAAKAEGAAAKKERDALKSRADSSTSAVAQANASKESTEKSLQQYKDRMNELIARFRETAQNLKVAETDRAALQGQLGERNAAFDVCAEKNLQLYEINGEVLNRYEHVGFFTKAAAAEPFAQITRTRIDNLVDDYRARAQELRIKKQAGQAEAPKKN